MKNYPIELKDGFILRRLNSSFVGEALKMRDEILEELRQNNANELYIVDESDDEFNEFFSNPDVYSLGVLAPDGELVAVGVGSRRRGAIVKFAKLIPDFDALPESAVGYVELAQVKKEYRGRGFQRLFFDELTEIFVETGARYVAGIVSPNNKPSLRNFEACGFKAVELFTHETTRFLRLKMLKDCRVANENQ